MDSNSSQDFWSQKEREDDGEQWWLTLHKAVGVSSERVKEVEVISSKMQVLKTGCTKTVKLDVLWHALMSPRPVCI